MTAMLKIFWLMLLNPEIQAKKIIFFQVQGTIWTELDDSRLYKQVTLKYFTEKSQNQGVDATNFSPISKIQRFKVN